MGAEGPASNQLSINNQPQAMTRRPAENEYVPYYHAYVSKVPDGDIITILDDQIGDMRRRVEMIPEEKETHAYAEGKWTVREVLGHLVDGERAFGHRAYCLSRREGSSLPGFDQNAYVTNAPYRTTPIHDLLHELTLVRKANLAMLRHLDDEAWLLIGTANGNSVSVRALAYIMVGHVRHHLDILADRYGAGRE